MDVTAYTHQLTPGGRNEDVSTHEATEQCATYDEKYSAVSSESP